MTLLDAPDYDYARARRQRNLLIGAAIVCVLVPVFLIAFWNWPSEHRVNRFFDALERQDDPQAFGIWNNDANWQSHPQQYAAYPYSRFTADWGPSGDYGVIRGHKILYATSHLGNVVLIAVQIDGKTTSLATLSVSKKDHTLDFSPFDLTPGEKKFGYTRWQISRHF